MRKYYNEKRKKEYVSVLINVSPDGEINPTSITLRDGRNYNIESTDKVCYAYAVKAGGSGVRYTVNINSMKTYLFEENGKWFVEAKIPKIPYNIKDDY